MSGSGANLPIRIQVEGGQAAEAAFNSVAATGERAMQRVGQGTQQASERAGTFTQAVGSAGFQIQDFAVQVQGGTSALTALSQQGSQFLGVFGTGGAIAGAVLTVGILAAQLLDIGNNGEDASEGVDALAKSMQEAAREAADLMRFLDGVNSRFISTIEAARIRDIRAIASDNTRLGAEGNSRFLELAEQQRLLSEDRARRASLAGTLGQGNDPTITTGGAISPSEARAIQDQIRNLDGQIASRETTLRDLQGQVARFDTLRQRNEGLLAGLNADSSGAANQGRPDDPPAARGGARGRAPSDSQGVNINAAIEASGWAQSQRALNAYNQELNLNDANLSAAAGALAQYERNMTMLSEALQNGVISEAQFATAVEESSTRLATQIETAQQRGQAVGNTGRELGFAFSSAFEDAIIKGKEFGDVLKGLAEDLAKLILRQTVTQPLANAIGQAVSGFSFGFGGSGTGATVSGGTKIGARAAGGPVFGGNSYLVGERGPEIITMGAAGTVTPNAGGGFSPTYNIDARGADPSILPRMEAIARSVSAQSLAQFADSIQRGGAAARLVGRR